MTKFLVKDFKNDKIYGEFDSLEDAEAFVKDDQNSHNLFIEEISDEKVNLPKKVTFQLADIFDEEEINGIMDKVSDKLSDKYGFCINDYILDVDITAKDIDWDTKE